MCACEAAFSSLSACCEAFLSKSSSCSVCSSGACGVVGKGAFLVVFFLFVSFSFLPFFLFREREGGGIGRLERLAGVPIFHHHAVTVTVQPRCHRLSSPRPTTAHHHHHHHHHRHHHHRHHHRPLSSFLDIRGSRLFTAAFFFSSSSEGCLGDKGWLSSFQGYRN